MVKNILIALGMGLLVVSSLYFYQRFKFQQQINEKFESLSEEQKRKIEGAMKVVNEGTLFKSKAEIESTKEEGNTVIQSEMKNIPLYAKGYFAVHENYGISISRNICQSYAFVNSFSKMAKYSLIPASCVVDNNFPAKSFTVTIPSLIGDNQMYCSDQNEFAGIVDEGIGKLVEGIKCR